MTKALPIGKLDSEVLQKIVFDNITYKRPEVLTRAGIGEDCASIDFEAMDCIVSTDPITASVKDVGTLSIHISCNDIATNGVQPIGILMTVLLPVGTTKEDVEQIMKQAAQAAHDCEVEIVGGHTEITSCVNQPVIVSTAIGRRPKGKTQSAEKMQIGDLIYITKSLALEGSGIIATEKEEEILARGILSQDEVDHAKDMLKKVSVIKEGLIAGQIGTHGMHDITEGGVLGAVWELCNIADMGCELDESLMPIDDVTEKIGLGYGVDILRLISSGAMLIIISEQKVSELESKMREAGVQLTRIGTIKDKEFGTKIIKKSGGSVEIEPPAADELYNIV